MRRPKRGGSTRSHSELPKLSSNIPEQKIKHQDGLLGYGDASDKRSDNANNAGSLDGQQIFQEEEILQKKEHIPQDKSLRASQFPLTLIQTLKFVTTIDTYSKIYGHIVVDENFTIIYADSQAKEIYEASLNSFYTHSLLDLIVIQDRDKFVSYCNQIIEESAWIQYLTYSRMTARKFQDCPELKHPNNMDYFFRYLKILSSQIIPVTINFTGFHRYSELFWNQKYLSKSKNMKMKCFVFRTRYCKEFPNLEGYNFSDDPIINKMEAGIRKKRIKNGTRQQKVEIKFEINKIIAEEVSQSTDSVLQGFQAECISKQNQKQMNKNNQRNNFYDSDTDIKPLHKKKLTIKKTKSQVKKSKELMKKIKQKKHVKIQTFTQSNKRTNKNDRESKKSIFNKDQKNQILTKPSTRNEQNYKKQEEQHSVAAICPQEPEKTKIISSLYQALRQQISNQKQNKHNNMIFFDFESQECSPQGHSSEIYDRDQNGHIFFGLRDDDDYIDQFIN